MAEKDPNIALVHEYLVQDGGAERVLRVFSDLFPEAPIYTLVHDPNKFTALNHRDIRMSFLKHIPLVRRKYPWLLSLMPSATEHLDMRPHNVVLSSSSSFAKGVITHPGSTHICYCHTPPRFLWMATREYIRELKIPKFVKWFLPTYLSHLRKWDQLAAQRVDLFIANSETVKERIRRYYKKDAVVVYPPVDTHAFTISDAPKNYFLAGGRVVAYKRFDLIIKACNRLKLPLKIYGDGRDMDDMKAMAGDTIEFLGRVSDEERAELYANCLAFIHPQEEDFGITPIEAMASGRPVIAYGLGGATETVIEGLSGTLFYEQTWEALADALMRFDETAYDPIKIREHAEQFSVDRFQEQMMGIIDRVVDNKTR